MNKSSKKWFISDTLWAQIEPLPPARKPHPLGRPNPRVPDRDAMNAIFFVLRTGCQRNALNVTGICSSSSAHRRFQEWRKAGGFLKLWQTGLEKYRETRGIDWSWLSMDGAINKAPLAGEKNRKQPYRQGKARRETQLANGCSGNSLIFPYPLLLMEPTTMTRR